MKNLELKKGKFTLYFILLILVLATMWGLRKCSSAHSTTVSDRAEGDTINVAIEISPISLSLAEDTLSGFHYDLIRNICNIHSRPVQISAFTNLSSALRQLDSGRYDVVIADIPVTSGMKEKYLYTDSIYIDRQVLVRLKDTITKGFTQNDLAGDTIWVPKGSLAVERLHNLSEEIGDTIYVVEDPKYGAEQLVILTALGQIKQAVVNMRYAQKLAEDYPQLDISTDISFNQFQSWVLAKENTVLCDSLNSWISAYKSTEEYSALCKRYF